MHRRFFCIFLAAQTEKKKKRNERFKKGGRALYLLFPGLHEAAHVRSDTQWLRLLLQQLGSLFRGGLKTD